MIQGLPLAILLLIVVMAFYVLDFYFIFRYDRHRQQGKGWAWDYTLLTVLMAMVVFLQPVLLPGIGWHTAASVGLAIQGLGLLVIVACLILHIWARRHLGKYYAERVEVQGDHQVIRSGPYAYVRHPVITSFFLLAIGIFLLNPALTTALVLIYTFWDFNRAARQEERLLSQELPGYQAYMENTPRFLPRVWSKRDRS